MNKKIWMGMLVILLVFGIVVVGCDNGTTSDNVGIRYEKSPQVSSVTVTKTTNSQFFIVSWDAVAGEANSYTLYFKQDGKVSTASISGAQNLYKYDSATGDQLPNENLDKWSVRISSLNASAAGSYCFGVRTSLGSTTVSTIASDIKWSNSFIVTNGPAMSTVTATPVTNNNYTIVTWDAIAGADSYLVTIYRDGSQYTTASGQNSVTYAVDTGTASVNTDPSKWSYYCTYTGGRFYFTVRATQSDVSILPSVSGNSNEVTTGSSNATQIAVASVTVTKTTNKQFFIISWDAVAGAGSYSLYFKQDGKITTTSISGAQNLYKYDPATGDQLPNENLDKWSARISSLVSLASAGGSYCFGVRNNNVNDITWSDSFTVTNGPEMSAISVTKTENGSYLIASWDAVAGVDEYRVVLYYNSSGNWYTYTTASGQNTYTYAESDGNTSENTDPSKWSFRYSNITTSYECYFSVSPVVSDISVLPSVGTSPIVR